MDWLASLKIAVAEGRETCHGGCGDAPEKLSLHGRHVGAWCWECWREVSSGKIPPLDRKKTRR
jgi:hypothetical protein